MLRYAACWIFPPLAFLGLFLGGPWTFLVPGVAFLLVPALELVLPPDRINLDPEAEGRRRASAVGDWLVWLLVPVQWGLLLTFLARFGELDALGRVGAIAAVGTCCGVFGINVGHELGHRPDRLSQTLAKLALLSSLYMHFFIEHNRGHHSRVATEADPASAPRGMTVFRFWARSLRGSFLSAWGLEAERLRRKGLSPWGFQNQFLRFQALHLLAILGAQLFFGQALAFAAAALVGILLLETVNYVEHYGLRRAVDADGRAERVRPEHSWNSDHPIGRVLLFELSRHSDHHANPGRPYTVLRSMPGAPQLPTGYPGMILSSLVPPLFFRIMDPLVEAQASAEAR